MLTIHEINDAITRTHARHRPTNQHYEQISNLKNVAGKCCPNTVLNSIS